MFVTIINDCRDENARGRQESRVAALCNGATISFIGVETDIEAAGNLIEVLDATEGSSGIVLVNVAPRGGHTRQWENGTPFGYAWYHDTLIVSTVDGYCFSALKKFELIEQIHVLDTHSAAEAMHAAHFITKAAAEHIPHTQFRSFDFSPRVAAFIFSGHEVPSEPMPVAEIPDLPPAVWWIDNFGNCKTTLTQAEVADKDILETRFGTFPVVQQLRDVPDSETAAVIGSSGLPEKRFVEIDIQRGNAAKQLGITVGDDIFTDAHYGLHV